MGRAHSDLTPSSDTAFLLDQPEPGAVDLLDAVDAVEIVRGPGRAAGGVCDDLVADFELGTGVGEDAAVEPGVVRAGRKREEEPGGEGEESRESDREESPRGHRVNLLFRNDPCRSVGGSVSG